MDVDLVDRVPLDDRVEDPDDVALVAPDLVEDRPMLRVPFAFKRTAPVLLNFWCRFVPQSVLMRQWLDCVGRL